MLLSFRDIRRIRVVGTDGDIGAVRNLLFDDRDWHVRYLVVDTGGLLKSHPVLLAPELVASLQSEERHVTLTVNRAHIADSPPVESHPPVSRHDEDAMRAYFGLSPRLGVHPTTGVDTWGQPTDAARGHVVQLERALAAQEHADPHLRSAEAWLGYGVEGTGVHLGSIDDVLFERTDARWQLRYIVVDTGHWLPGNRRLVATDWIAAVSHDARHVRLDATRERMAQAPDFEDVGEIDHGAERWLLHHYGVSPKR